MTSVFAFVLFGFLVAGILFAFIRLLMGPKGTDRAVSLDTITLISTNLLVLIAFLQGRSMLIDVAIVYSILSFLGVLTIARYLDGGLR